MSDEAHQKAVSGEAWAEFCDTLKSAGRLVVEHSTDDLDRIEGFRYLSRLARGGLFSYLENRDRVFSDILPIPFNLKIGCDNPDADYRSVPVDPAHTYRIHGTRGTVNFLSLNVLSGGLGAGAKPPGRDGTVTFNDPDPDGVIDVIVSVAEPELAEGQCWLQMGPDASMIAVRNFFLDRTNEKASELTIECLDPPTPTPPPLTADQLTHGLAMAGLYVHGVADRFLGWVEDLFVPRSNTLEFLPDDDPTGAWGDPNQDFRHGYWTLDHGQALVIRVPAIDAYYWNFQLNNMWEESLDYRNLSVTVNKHTAVYEPDGSALILVADENPGIGNWMDTAGHRRGTMGLRYNQVVADIPPDVTVMPVSRLGELAGARPTGEMG